MGRKDSPKKNLINSYSCGIGCQCTTEYLREKGSNLVFANLILFNLEVIDEKQFVLENNFERGGNFRM